MGCTRSRCGSRRISRAWPSEFCYASSKLGREAQKAQRLDRIGRESRADELRREIQAGHEADLGELAVLRKERTEHDYFDGIASVRSLRF